MPGLHPPPRRHESLRTPARHQGNQVHQDCGRRALQHPGGACQFYALCQGGVGSSAVALTQISAYSTHKNVGVRKIMEVKQNIKCGIRFSISFRWYAIPNFCTQISRPLTYGIRISSKASTTAGSWEWVECLFYKGTRCSCLGLENLGLVCGVGSYRLFKIGCW